VKHISGIVSTDEGIQIDSIDVQLQNADCPKLETRQSESNLTDETEWQFLKQPAEMATIELPIVTSGQFPKYRIRQLSLELTRKSPKTRKKGFSASTVMLRIPEFAMAKPVI
jgi:hypothetical protein